MGNLEGFEQEIVKICKKTEKIQKNTYKSYGGRYN